MRNIVSTIQREQNQIIRDTHADLLFVQGAAGSGKTSAALQRVAYLLYRYRPELKANQMILFSPNQLFSDYVNHVLPSLGEHNLIRMTYYQYSNHRANEFAVETLAQRFAKAQRSNRLIDHLKNSLTFYRAVNRYLRDLNRDGMHFKNVMFNHRIFISKERIYQIYYGFNSNYDLNNRLSATRDQLLVSLHRRIKTEMKKPWVSNAIEDMNRQQLRYLQLSYPNEFQNMDHSYDFLAKHIVIGAFRQVKRQIVHNRFISINRQYIHLLREMPNYIDLNKFQIRPEAWQRNINQIINGMNYQSISMADVSVYLYLYDRVTGSLGHRDIKYVFVDEAQDYTAFQMAFLRYEFPNAKFTVLGDLNQAIFTRETGPHLLKALKAIFKGRSVRTVTLRKSYRSTRQITDFTKHLLPDGRQIQSYARDGSKPRLLIQVNRGHELASLVKLLKFNQHRYQTTAIIGKDLASCRILSRQLRARKISNHLIQSENQRLLSGVLVLPAYLAKGLEFDAVVMWDASPQHYSKDDYQLAYTICTRAMHQLSIIGITKLSPLFNSVPKRLYTLVSGAKGN